MDVTVSIVTYNSVDTISECLKSVEAQRGLETEVIVVDNASRDETRSVLERWGRSVQLIANSENIGFGRGHNEAAGRARGRFLHVLNPDATFLQSDSLLRLVESMNEHRAWGVCGPLLRGHEGRPFETEYPGERHVRTRLVGLPGDIAWIHGASMFFRKSAFEEVNGFDPRFFLYGEETDICLRLRKAGYEIGHVNAARVGHVGGASQKSNRAYDIWRQRQRGLYQFFGSHYSREDVERLRRRDLRIARFRLALLSITGGVRRNAERAAKYTAIWDHARAFLLPGDREGPG